MSDGSEALRRNLEMFPVPRDPEEGIPIGPDPIPARRTGASPLGARRRGDGDRLRMEHYHELRDEGVEPLDAWWEAISGPLERGGLRRYIGKDRPPDSHLLRTLRRHSARLQPDATNEALQLVRDDLLGLAGQATAVIREILEERPGKDAAAGANAQLAAAKATLDYSGVSKPKAGIQVNTQVNVQQTAGEASRDRVREIIENPRALEAALELERALEDPSCGDEEPAV